MKISWVKKLAVVTILVSALVLTMLGGCTGGGKVATKTLLRFAVPAFDAEVFDPILHSGIAMYAHLMYTDFAGSDLHDAAADKRWGLAYDWESNEDSTEWTFRMRKDSFWWDGVPVTAQDVKIAIQRQWSERSRVGTPDVIKTLMGGDKADEESQWRIEIVDDYTINFHLAESSFRYPELMSSIDNYGRAVPKHYIDQYGEEALAKGEIGNGPYKIVEHISGSLIRFNAWPEHKYLQPAFQQIDLMAVPEESTRLAMMRTGELDVSEFSLERLPGLEAEGFDIIKKPTGTLWTILFTEPYKDPIMAKKEVRKAIAQSIDYESFNKAFFNGAGIYINDGGNLAQCIDPRGVITRAPVPYDLEAAKATVARLVPSDYRLQFIGVIRDNVENQHVEAVAGMLEKAGFNVDIQLHDYATFRPDWQDGKIGAGVYLKDGRLNAIYYPTIYGNSPEGRGRHHLISLDLANKKVLSKVEVNPAIPWEDLLTIQAMDNLISGKMVTAKNWDEYWAAYAEVMDRAIENVAPGSGFLFTTRIFAADPEIMPTQWEINLGWDSKINIKELAVVPPEYEDAKYHPEEYEGKR